MKDDDLSALTSWRVLLALNAFFVLFGVATAWLSALPPASLWRAWIAAHLYDGAMSHDMKTLYDFMCGPLGGTMAGSYLLQTWLVWIPLRQGQVWAWWAIASAMTLWFIVDSAVSLAHGAWFNVAYVNLPALLVMYAALGWFARSAKLPLRSRRGA